MNEREALKLALKSLEFYYDLYREKVDAEAITAIKEALAQPEQEPIGINGLTEAETSATASVMGLVNTTPPQRKPLTDEQPQRWAVFCGICRKEWTVPYQHPGKSVCRECEAAHGIKE